MRTLDGPIKVAFRDFVIPSDMIVEARMNLEEGEIERSTHGGTFKRGNGITSESMAEVDLLIPSWDWFGKNILRSRYEEAEDPEEPGRIVWNAQTCSGESDHGPLNIAYKCDTNDENDIHFYDAWFKLAMDATFSVDEALQVTVAFFANPDDDGNVFRMGTGDLTGESVWDAETEQTIPVTS